MKVQFQEVLPGQEYPALLLLSTDEDEHKWLKRLQEAIQHGGKVEITFPSFEVTFEGNGKT